MKKNLNATSLTAKRACILLIAFEIVSKISGCATYCNQLNFIHLPKPFYQSDCLNGLLHCDVNVNIRTSKFQQTPLHVAAFGGHPCILLKLLNCGADYNAKVSLYNVLEFVYCQCKSVDQVTI